MKVDLNNMLLYWCFGVLMYRHPAGFLAQASGRGNAFLAAKYRSKPIAAYVDYVIAMRQGTFSVVGYSKTSLDRFFHEELIH